MPVLFEIIMNVAFLAFIPIAFVGLIFAGRSPKPKQHCCCCPQAKALAGRGSSA